MSKILAIDTVSDACSVALSCDTGIFQQSEVAPREHGRLLLAMVDETLANAELRLQDLDAVAFGRGPGAFTGVRIAASVIQGLAFGADLPVVPISSLASLAHGMARTKPNCQANVLAAFDARMGELYWGAYQVTGLGELTLQGEEQVAKPEDVIVPEGVWLGAGSGWQTYLAELSERLGEQLSGTDGSLLPSAYDVLELAKVQYQKQGGVPAEQALPVYLRNNVAAKPKRPPETY